MMPFKENAFFFDMPLLSPYIPVSGKSVAFWITSYSPYYGKWCRDQAREGKDEPAALWRLDYAQVKPRKGREGKDIPSNRK